MLVRTRLLSIVVALGALLSSTVRGTAQDSVPGRDHPPQIGVATVSRDGEIEVCRFVRKVIPQNVVREVTVGQEKRTVMETRITEVIQKQKRQIAAGVLTASRANGAIVDRPELLKLLSKPTPVLLADDGRKTDEFFLQIVKPDTLVLELPISPVTALQQRIPLESPYGTTLRPSTDPETELVPLPLGPTDNSEKNEP
jgi:hypothetical protein